MVYGWLHIDRTQPGHTLFPQVSIIVDQFSKPSGTTGGALSCWYAVTAGRGPLRKGEQSAGHGTDGLGSVSLLCFSRPSPEPGARPRPQKRRREGVHPTTSSCAATLSQHGPCAERWGHHACCGGPAHYPHLPRNGGNQNNLIARVLANGEGAYFLRPQHCAQELRGSVYSVCEHTHDRPEKTPLGVGLWRTQR